MQILNNKFHFLKDKHTKFKLLKKLDKKIEIKIREEKQ